MRCAPPFALAVGAYTRLAIGPEEDVVVVFASGNVKLSWGIMAVANQDVTFEDATRNKISLHPRFADALVIENVAGQTVALYVDSYPWVSGMTPQVIP